MVVAAVSRWAPRLDGLLTQRLYESYPPMLQLVDEVERDGLLPPLFEGSFQGYTHRPEELRQEIRDAGLRVDDLVNVEGLSFALADLEERLADPVARGTVYAGARAIQRVPELLGLGPHLLALARVSR